METDKKTTLLAVLYVLASYAGPLVWWKVPGEKTAAINLILVIPFFIGIINAVYIKINFQKSSRMTLLKCTLMVKYLLIPMYIIGGWMIVVLFLLIFTPIVIMIFFSPFMIAMLSIYGYLIMLGGNAFSLAYIRKAREEGVYGTFLSTAGKILQFFFVTDVASMVFFSLKEKKYIAAAVTTIVLLALGFLGILGWLVITIVKAAML